PVRGIVERDDPAARWRFKERSSMSKDPVIFLRELPPYTRAIATQAGRLLRKCARSLNPEIREPSLRQNTLGAYLGRTVLWMKSLAKLGHPTDNQPIAAAARSLLEVAADSLFVHGDKSEGTARRIDSWAESAEFDAAQKLVNYFSRNGRSLPPNFSGLPSFLTGARAQVTMNRAFLTLCKKFDDEKRHHEHPSNWGRDLRGQCERLDKEQPCKQCQAGFVATQHYVENFKLTCWLVHGSGFSGFK